MSDAKALKAALRRAVRVLPALECEDLAGALGLDTRDCGAGDDVCEACMLEVADAIAARMMPEGMEWPRFEDGEPVRIGNEVDSPDGPFEVFCVRFARYGFEVSDAGRVKAFDALFGDTLERFDTADTQERIDSDVTKTPCSYFNRDGAKCYESGSGDKCPALEAADCRAAQALDLLRRQRELCAKEAAR